MTNGLSFLIVNRNYRPQTWVLDPVVLQIRPEL